MFSFSTSMKCMMIVVMVGVGKMPLSWARVSMFVSEEMTHEGVGGDKARRRSLARHSAQADAYVYYDADYDDRQNELLAFGALQERLQRSLEKISSAYLPYPLGDNAYKVGEELGGQMQWHRLLLEQELTAAGSDGDLQRQALDRYYAYAQALVTRKDLRQLLQIYYDFKKQYDEELKVFSELAKKNRFGYMLSERVQEDNPQAAYEGYFNQMEKLDALLRSLELELKLRTREEQILKEQYVGLSGKLQKLSDYFHGKGKYASKKE